MHAALWHAASDRKLLSNSTVECGNIRENDTIVDPNDLEIVKYIDQGRFSTVFEVFSTSKNKSYVLKVLKVWDLERLAKEVRILQKLAGAPNIVRLTGQRNSPETWITSLLFDSTGSDAVPLNQVWGELNSTEIKMYMYKLLIALNESHSRGIMHRDIKVVSFILLNHAISRH